MNGNAIDWKTLCALSRLFDEIGYPAEKFLIAMKDASEYNGGKQQNGELRGTKTQLARAVGCKPETIVNVFERLLRLENGGNEILRTTVNPDNPKELCFQSEAAKNALNLMTEKRQAKIQRRAARRLERQSKESDEPAAPPVASGVAPIVENAYSRAGELDKLKRERNYLLCCGDSVSRERAAEIDKQIQDLETAPAADFETALASLEIIADEPAAPGNVPAP